MTTVQMHSFDVFLRWIYYLVIPKVALFKMIITNQICVNYLSIMKNLFSIIKVPYYTIVIGYILEIDRLPLLDSELE